LLYTEKNLVFRFQKKKSFYCVDSFKIRCGEKMGCEKKKKEELERGGVKCGIGVT